MIDAASLRMARTILDRAGEGRSGGCVERRRQPPSRSPCPSVPVIRVSGIRKAYGPVVAVDDVSFEVRRGEIFGLVGPERRRQDHHDGVPRGAARAGRAARIAVLGLDPFRDGAALKVRIGVQLQEAQLQKRITVREAVRLLGLALSVAGRPGGAARPARACATSATPGS